MIQIQLIYNLSLLVALSVLSGFIISYYPLNTYKGRIFQGLLFGMAAVLGMMNPLTIQAGLIFDGRSVLISIVALFFGPIPALIAASITLIYRIMIGGPGTIMGVLVILESITVGLIFHYYIRRTNKQIDALFLFIMGLVVHIIMLFFMLFLPSGLVEITIETLASSVLSIYPLATILVGKIIYDQEHNRKLIKDLQKSEHNLKSYFNYAPDAIFVVDEKGNYLDSNTAATKMTGYTQNEINSMNIMDFCPPEDLDIYQNHFSKVVDNNYVLGELKYLRKDGSIGWWTVDAVKIADNKFIGYSKEITQKKESDFKLQESLNEFQAVFNLAPDAMFIISLEDNVYVDLNTMYEILFKYSREELIGKKSGQFQFWKNPERREELIKLLVEISIVKGFETELQDRYGNTINALISASIIQINKKDHILGIITDISEKKESELKLIESESNFRRLIEKLPDGYYRSTPDGKFLYVNPAMVSILGYDSADELLNIDIVQDLYFDPEERDINNINQEKNDYEVYRLKRKDGGIVWIEEHSKYILDDNNQIILHEGICRDITDRVNSELANTELIARMKKVSAHLPGFIFQFEMKPDGKFTFPYASDGIIDVYCVTPEEVKLGIEKVWQRLHPDDLDRIMLSINQSARNLTIWREEYRVIHKSGKVIWIEGYCSPEKLNDGSVLWHGYISDITDRKLIEESNKEKEFSLKFAQEIAKMGSWEYDVLNNKVYWSENYYKIFGFEESKYQPGNYTFLERVHPEDYDYVVDIVKKYEKKSVGGSFEFRIVMPDGTIKWLQNSFIPIFINDKLAYLKGVNIDITDRKISEINLRQLSRAIEQSPLSVVITDLDANIEYVNPAFLEFTGYTFEEIIGKNTRILKSDKMPVEFYERMWNTLIEGKIWQSEIINKKKNGEIYWESITIAPTADDQGRITNYIAIKEDITEKKRLYDELIKEKEHAEESDRLKSAFLANMSHEIRTPLNGIIGFSKLMASTDLDYEERQEYSQILYSSCNRLLNTVNDILDISKIEANQMEVKSDYFSAYNLINELYDFYYANFSSKGIALKYIVSVEDQDYILYSDEQKIYQILNNLLNNALKFTKVGEVSYGYSIFDDNIEFFVQDSGIGISEEAIDFIFGRFNQENNELNRGFEGTGLGLPICQGLAILLGGNIRVETKYGEGSKFIVTLPVKSV